MASGKVAILGRDNSKNVWYGYDPSTGVIESEDFLDNTAQDGGILTHGDCVFYGCFAGMGDKVYFAGNGNPSGLELWSYDGETQKMAADIYSGPTSSNPWYYYEMNGQLVMQAVRPNPGSSFEVGTIVAYDPTTGLARPLFPEGSNGALAFYRSGHVHLNELYMRYGSRFWVWNGTEASPELISNIDPAHFASFGDRLFACTFLTIYEIDTATKAVTEF